MAPDSDLPSVLQDVLRRLPSSPVPVSDEIIRLFDDLKFNPLEDVNVSPVAAEGRVTDIFKQVISAHNERAPEGDRVYFCPTRDGCAADMSFYSSSTTARDIRDLDARMIGAQTKVLTYNRFLRRLRFAAKECNADLYEGMVMVVAMCGVPGFWMPPWSSINLLRGAVTEELDEVAGRVYRGNGPRRFVMTYSPEELASWAQYWTPVGDLPQRLLSLIRGGPSYGVSLRSFSELNMPTSLWQRCELAGNLQIRMLVLLALGLRAVYPEEEMAVWDVGFFSDAERKILRVQEKTVLIHETRTSYRINLAIRKSTKVYAYGADTAPTPDADLFVYSANGCISFMTARAAFEAGLLHGTRAGEEVPGSRRHTLSKADLDRFASIASVESLRQACAACEAALADLLVYGQTHGAVGLPAADLLDLLASELPLWFGEPFGRLMKLAAALREINFDEECREGRALAAEYKRVMIESLHQAAAKMEEFSKPFEKVDLATYPPLRDISPSHFWRVRFVPRDAPLSTITEIYRGSLCGFEGVTKKEGSWSFEVADLRHPKGRTARKYGLATEWDAAREYDWELLRQHPVPHALCLTNAVRLVAANGGYVGLSPHHKQLETMMRLAALAEVDPMRFFGEDPRHAPYPGVLRSPASRRHLGAWQVRVREKVKAYADTPAQAADKADPHLALIKASTSHGLLGVQEGKVAETVDRWNAEAAARRFHAQLADAENDEEPLASTQSREAFGGETRGAEPLSTGFVFCRTVGEKAALVEKVLEEHETYGVPEPLVIGQGLRGAGMQGTAGALLDEGYEEYREHFLEAALPVIDRIYAHPDADGVGPSEITALVGHLKELHNLITKERIQEETIQSRIRQLEEKAEAEGFDLNGLLTAAGAAAGLEYSSSNFETYRDFRRRLQGAGGGTGGPA